MIKRTGVKMANIFDLFKQISSDSSKSTGNVEYIIAGLGNPGKEYEKTRHNAGFMAMDYISGRVDAKIDRAKFSALVGEATIEGKRVLLMKPQTFMNSSGEAISAAARFYKIPAENIIVIADDISLDVGRLRVRRKGSHGGHNGLRSIEAQLSSQDYQRIKIGVGAKPNGWDLADFVLSRFAPNERKNIDEAIDKSVEAIATILSDSFEKAMNLYNN